nr:hypothetical protein [Tanacetum cinerariifolium]
MSTSTTHQQSLADAGFETRSSMLERGMYIPWVSHFRRCLNRKRENRKWLNKAIDEVPYVFKNFTPEGSQTPTLQTNDDLKHYEAEIEAMNLILISIPNDIYNSVDACTTAQAMLTEDSYDDLFDYLSQYEQLFNTSKANKLEKSHDPLALVAHMEEIIESNNVQNDAGNIQRTLRTTSSGSAANVQCYNCSEKEQPKIINNTLGDDQIDSNFIFDKPNIDVNSGSVEYDNNVQASYELEQLARNTYKEAEKQQINANKVKQQNNVLTQQLKLYKEKVRVFEMTKGDKETFFIEFIEFDRQARQIEKYLQNQFIRDLDIIRDLEQQQDKL